MKLTPILALFTSAALPLTAMAQGPKGAAQGLKYSLGAGAIYAPTYLGDDDYQASLFPNISASYGDRFKASFRGIEYSLVSKNGWEIGSLVSYDFGREEQADGPFAIVGDKSNDLVGLGDIDGTVELGGFIKYETGSFAFTFGARTGIDGGHDGVHGAASISYRKRIKIIGRPTFISIGPEVAYADEAYNSTYFSITAAQSAASGISEYQAGGGINSVGLHLTAMMPLSKKTALVGVLNYDQLSGDVGDSTIVSERGSADQLRVGLFVNYTF